MFGWFKKETAPSVKNWMIPNGSIVSDEKLKYCMRAKSYHDSKTVAIIGYDRYNPENPILLDLTTAPHVLVAGTTGSGKSVSVNTLLCSLILKNSPADLKISICDPKMVDYNAFKGLPHVVSYTTGIDDTANTLENIYRKMMNRYELMQKQGVSNIADMPEKFPRILFVMDEFASLMSKEGKKKLVPVLQDILRLGRAAGVHCILATQRPDRTVIDGQLKANCPTRLCFRVQSSTDSRVIMDFSGGEKLRGMGDGLYMRSNGDLFRFQGLLIDDSQKKAILDYWKKQAQ